MSALLMVGLPCAPAARAEPPAPAPVQAAVQVQVEVNFLLGYLEGSKCEFYRNGTWHDSQAAQAHLRDKYNYLVAKNLVGTTEQFIERAASTSSLSGEPYKVKCNGAAVMTSQQWLRDELARFRAF